MKLLWLIAFGCIACKWLAGRWPWELTRASALSRERTQARNLLGVAPSAGREDILDAHRRLIARVHPDRGGSEALVHEANAARDTLLGALAPKPE